MFFGLKLALKDKDWKVKRTPSRTTHEMLKRREVEENTPIE